MDRLHAAGWIMCGLACFVAIGSAVAELTPVDLRTEYRANPEGIATAVPRFTWILQGNGRNLAQSAWQILVADAPDLLAGDTGNLWDSGKVTGRESALIPYGGKGLTSRSRCWWKVRVWDQDGKVGPWSEPAYFSVGLLNRDDWQARWIGYDTPEQGGPARPEEPLAGSNWIWYPEGDPAHEVPAGKRWFFKIFRLPEGVITEATLFMTADNKAKAWINNINVCEGHEAANNWGRLYRYPVRDALRAGENRMIVEAANTHGAAALILVLEARYEDGKTVRIVSDGEWLTSREGPARSDWTQVMVVCPYGEGPWHKPMESDVYTPPAVLLRREFELSKPVKRAVLYASALGIHDTLLNGRRVGDVVFPPGWTDYNKRVYHNTFDVTSLVNPGRNAFAVTLAEGWYCGNIGLVGRDHYGKHPRYLAQLEVEYEDGSREVVVTDETWKAGYGHVRVADLLMGETHDYRMVRTGWEQPGYDDAGWQPVVTEGADAVKAVIQPHPGVPVRVQQTLTAKNRTEPKPGVYVYDMGQNMVGWVRLTCQGKKGQPVTVRHAERLQPEDGMLYTESLRKAKATDTYIPAEDGVMTVEPRFTFHGFQYVEITGVETPPAPEDVVGVVVHSDIPRTAWFETDHPLLNRLHENIVWGQKGNYLEVPTDCPQRDERLGWTGDAQFFMPTALYTADIGAFHTKWLVDLVQDSQLPNGSFGHVAPNVVKDGGAVAWGDAAIICPYLMYRFYGDKRVLEAHYANMARSMQWMVDTSENYIRKDLGFGDWVNLGGGAKDEVICTAYFAYLAGLMAEIASVIGKEDDAAKYRELREHIRDAFIQAFVGQDGRILDSSQTGYALAFTIDLIPEPLRNAAADRFVEEIAKFKWHLATGFIGTPRLLPALALAGREDVAYRLLLNETYPSWLYQVKLGATTMWERWNGWTPEQGFADPGMNSFNHYAFGSVGQFMYEYVAGVRPLEPGFGRFIVAPRPGGGLKHASLRYRSIRGEIASKWEALEGDRLRLTVEVPPNTTAVVSLPPGARNVTMNGTEITGLETEVGSGSWVFEMQYAVPPLMQVSE
ncbi:MAG TPA: family 78 glycoside hydrolase catalytic domain [Candidatus Hydrogenedentes bacterium]|nr:family 78 glycoside hydrolase catalytic domain [Candidatus Hydrogenedentota bacterium]